MKTSSACGPEEAVVEDGEIPHPGMRLHRCAIDQQVAIPPLFEITRQLRFRAAHPGVLQCRSRAEDPEDPGFCVQAELVPDGKHLGAVGRLPIQAPQRPIHRKRPLEVSVARFQTEAHPAREPFRVQPSPRRLHQTRANHQRNTSQHSQPEKRLSPPAALGVQPHGLDIESRNQGHHGDHRQQESDVLRHLEPDCDCGGDHHDQWNGRAPQPRGDRVRTPREAPSARWNPDCRGSLDEFPGVSCEIPRQQEQAPETPSSSRRIEARVVGQRPFRTPKHRVAEGKHRVPRPAPVAQQPGARPASSAHPPEARRRRTRAPICRGWPPPTPPPPAAAIRACRCSAWSPAPAPRPAPGRSATGPVRPATMKPPHTAPRPRRRSPPCRYKPSRIPTPQRELPRTTPRQTTRPGPPASVPSRTPAPRSRNRRRNE